MFEASNYMRKCLMVVNVNGDNSTQIVRENERSHIDFVDRNVHWWLYQMQYKIIHRMQSFDNIHKFLIKCKQMEKARKSKLCSMQSQAEKKEEHYEEAILNQTTRKWLVLRVHPFPFHCYKRKNKSRNKGKKSITTKFHKMSISQINIQKAEKHDCFVTRLMLNHNYLFPAYSWLK